MKMNGISYTTKMNAFISSSFSSHFNSNLLRLFGVIGINAVISNVVTKFMCEK